MAEEDEGPAAGVAAGVGAVVATLLPDWQGQQTSPVPESRLGLKPGVLVLEHLHPFLRLLRRGKVAENRRELCEDTAEDLGRRPIEGKPCETLEP